MARGAEALVERVRGDAEMRSLLPAVDGKAPAAVEGEEEEEELAALELLDDKFETYMEVVREYETGRLSEARMAACRKKMEEARERLKALPEGELKAKRAECIRKLTVMLKVRISACLPLAAEHSHTRLGLGW